MATLEAHAPPSQTLQSQPDLFISEALPTPFPALALEALRNSDQESHLPHRVQSSYLVDQVNIVYDLWLNPLAASVAHLLVAMAFFSCLS